MRLHPRLVVVGEVSLEEQGLEAEPTPRAADPLAQLDGVGLDELRQRGQGARRPRQIAPRHRDAVGGPRRRQHPPVSVEDVATRGVELLRPHGIALGAARELLALQDLELEEAEGEDAEDQEDHEDRQGQAALDAALGAGPEARPRSGLATDHVDRVRGSSRSGRWPSSPPR